MRENLHVRLKALPPSRQRFFLPFLPSVSLPTLSSSSRCIVLQLASGSVIHASGAIAPTRVCRDCSAFRPRPQRRSFCVSSASSASTSHRRRSSDASISSSAVTRRRRCAPSFAYPHPAHPRFLASPSLTSLAFQISVGYHDPVLSRPDWQQRLRLQALGLCRAFVFSPQLAGLFLLAGGGGRDTLVSELQSKTRAGVSARFHEEARFFQHLGYILCHGVQRVGGRLHPHNHKAQMYQKKTRL